MRPPEPDPSPRPCGRHKWMAPNQRAALHFAGRHFPGSQTITSSRRSYVLESLNLISHGLIDVLSQKITCFNNRGLIKYYEGPIVRVSTSWIDEYIVV